MNRKVMRAVFEIAVLSGMGAIMGALLLIGATGGLKEWFL